MFACNETALRELGRELLSTFSRSLEGSLLWLEQSDPDAAFCRAFDSSPARGLILYTQAAITVSEDEDFDQLSRVIESRWASLQSGQHAGGTSPRLFCVQPVRVTANTPPSSTEKPTEIDRALIVAGHVGGQSFTTVLPITSIPRLPHAIFTAEDIGNFVRRLMPEKTAPAVSFRGFQTNGDQLGRWASQHGMVATWDPWRAPIQVSNLRKIDLAVNQISTESQAPGSMHPLGPQQPAPGQSIQPSMPGNQPFRSPPSTSSTRLTLPERGFARVFTPGQTFDVSIGPARWHIETTQELAAILRGHGPRTLPGRTGADQRSAIPPATPSLSTPTWQTLRQALAGQQNFEPDRFASLIQQSYADPSVPVVLTGSHPATQRLAQALAQAGIRVAWLPQSFQNPPVMQWLNQWRQTIQVRQQLSFLIFSSVLSLARPQSSGSGSVRLPALQSLPQTWIQVPAPPPPDWKSFQILEGQHPWYLVGDDQGRELAWVLDAEHLWPEQIATQARQKKAQLGISDDSQIRVLVVGNPGDRHVVDTITALTHIGCHVESLQLSPEEHALERPQLYKLLAHKAAGVNAQFVVYVPPRTSENDDDSSEPEDPQLLDLPSVGFPTPIKPPLPLLSPLPRPRRDTGHIPTIPPLMGPPGGVLVNPVPVELPDEIPDEIPERIKEQLRQGHSPIRPLQGVLPEEN